MKTYSLYYQCAEKETACVPNENGSSMENYEKTFQSNIVKDILSDFAKVRKTKSEKINHRISSQARKLQGINLMTG